MTLDTVTSGRTTDASTRVSSGPAHAPEKGASLHANELNLFDETAVAVSSTAPAYSLAATVGLLFVAVAYAGPAIIIVSFIPMLFIAGSYFYLNRKDPNCGAAYEWISRFVGPHIGWFNGWVQLAASILFCVAAPLLAGTYTLQFFQAVGWINASTASEMSLAASIGQLETRAADIGEDYARPGAAHGLALAILKGRLGLPGRARPTARASRKVVERPEHLRRPPHLTAPLVSELDENPSLNEGLERPIGVSSCDGQLVRDQRAVDDWVAQE